MCWAVICSLCCLLAWPAGANAGEEDVFARSRRQMVEYQLRARGIADAAVLRAMEKVPRHRFVRPALESQAYSDRALPTEEGQTI